jgi:deleted-in-malignant-brain-tumors protein 1
LPAGAAFCNRCGADVRALAALGAPQAAQPAMRARPGVVAVGRGMPVCHACGALAPSGRASCEVCQQPIGSSLEAVPPRSDDLCFAQVRTEITCRQCGGSFPLDEPELEEAVTCPRCATTQAFELGAWGEAFELAHCIADVHGPRGERFRRELGARDPHPEIGRGTAVAELRLTGMTIEGGVMKSRNLRASCAPGQPLCTKCGSPREPLEATGLRAAPELQLRCVGCGDTARYAIPSVARSLAPGVVGFVAEALRTDRPEARLDMTSAGMVIALRCPSCGGGLNVSPGSHAATCAFCKTESRIASRTLLALKSTDAAAAPWWVVFRGDAAARRELAREDARGSGRLDPLEAVRAFSGEDTQLLALLAMAESPGGEKVVRRAMSKKITGVGEDVSPGERRKEWALQLMIPLVMLAFVAPLFHTQISRWIGGGLSVAPSVALAGGVGGAPLAPRENAPRAPITILLSHEGEVRPVCDDGFGIEEAQVACRQLGHQGATGFSTVSGSTDEFWLDDVVCTGQELRLDDCQHEGWGEENCTRSETQAVTCY